MVKDVNNTEVEEVVFHVDDDLSWSEKLKRFKAIITALKQSRELGSVIVNSEEIIDQLADVTLETIKSYDKKQIQKEFMFYADNKNRDYGECSEFFKLVFDNKRDLFRELIDETIKKKALKAFISSVVFFHDNSKLNEPIDDDIVQSYNEKIKSLGLDIDEKDLPSTFSEYEFFKNLPIVEASNITIGGFLGCMKECSNKPNYSTVVSESTIETLVKEDVLTFDSLHKFIKELDQNVDLDILKENFDLLVAFFRTYVEHKTNLKENRGKLINILLTYRVNGTTISDTILDALNQILMLDNETSNTLKAEWLEETLKDN